MFQAAPCFLLTIGATRVLLDAGLHPARRHSAERYPAFTAIPSPSTIDVVLLSHAHLDHAGALPLFTEVVGHPGPVYASAATRDLLPPLFDDLLAGGGGGDGPPVLPPYTAAQAAAAVAKVVATPPPGTPWSPAAGVVVVASLAGHTLGALSFSITAHGRRVVYAGDLSVDEGPPSPLPPAVLDRTAPRADLLILEATAAGTWARPPRATRAAGLVAAVAAAVRRGGKALLAVPAVGRYQEVLLLLDAAAQGGGSWRGFPSWVAPRWAGVSTPSTAVMHRCMARRMRPRGGGEGGAAASPPPAPPTAPPACGDAVTGAPPPPATTFVTTTVAAAATAVAVGVFPHHRLPAGRALGAADCRAGRAGRGRGRSWLHDRWPVAGGARCSRRGPTKPGHCACICYCQRSHVADIGG
ncbi:hypothetical protein MMPV_001018 [Pyropia vietnamensis]